MAAQAAGKATVVLREAELSSHGGVTRHMAENDLALLTGRSGGALSDDERGAVRQLLDSMVAGGGAEVIDWHREKDFKYAALARIAEIILEQQLERLHLSHAPTLRIKDQTRAPRSGRTTRVLHMSEHYKSLKLENSDEQQGEAMSAFDCVAAHLAPYGVRLQTEARAGVPTVVMLCPGVFKSPALVDELASLFGTSHALERRKSSLPRRQSSSKLESRLVTVYSTSLPFHEFISTCPPLLRDQGLLNKMFDKWPETAMLRDVAAQKIVLQLPPQAVEHYSLQLRAREELGGVGTASYERFVRLFRSKLAAHLQISEESIFVDKVVDTASVASSEGATSENVDIEGALGAELTVTFHIVDTVDAIQADNEPPAAATAEALASGVTFGDGDFTVEADVARINPPSVPTVHTVGDEQSTGLADTTKPSQSGAKTRRSGSKPSQSGAKTRRSGSKPRRSDGASEVPAPKRMPAPARMPSRPEALRLTSSEQKIFTSLSEMQAEVTAHAVLQRAGVLADESSQAGGGGEGRGGRIPAPTRRMHGKSRTPSGEFQGESFASTAAASSSFNSTGSASFNSAASSSFHSARSSSFNSSSDGNAEAAEASHQAVRRARRASCKAALQSTNTVSDLLGHKERPGRETLRRSGGETTWRCSREDFEERRSQEERRCSRSSAAPRQSILASETEEPQPQLSAEEALRLEHQMVVAQRSGEEMELEAIRKLAKVSRVRDTLLPVAPSDEAARSAPAEWSEKAHPGDTVLTC